ncbi:MAG: hypothetical protein ACLS6O_01490 [Bifidobacterium sp.]
MVANGTKVDVAKEGTYEATLPPPMYGNEFNVAATVYVGALTVSDRYHSAGCTSASEASRGGCAGVLHVKASPAFEGDAAKVTWNWMA